MGKLLAKFSGSAFQMTSTTKLLEECFMGIFTTVGKASLALGIVGFISFLDSKPSYASLLNGSLETGNLLTTSFQLESTTPIILDGPWYEFQFFGAGEPAVGCLSGGCVSSSAGNSQFVGDPPWTFLAPASGALLTVTDAFLRGDVFDIFDFGTRIGSTSTVEVGGSCVPNETNPDDCLNDPLTSSGIFALAAGNHSITITPSVSPFGGGAAYFRVDTAAANVPEPSSTIGFLTLGVLGATSQLKRKQRRTSLSGSEN